MKNQKTVETQITIMTDILEYFKLLNVQFDDIFIQENGISLTIGDDSHYFKIHLSDNCIVSYFKNGKHYEYPYEFKDNSLFPRIYQIYIFYR